MKVGVYARNTYRSLITWLAKGKAFGTVSNVYTSFELDFR